MESFSAAKSIIAFFGPCNRCFPDFGARKKRFHRAISQYEGGISGPESSDGHYKTDNNAEGASGAMSKFVTLSANDFLDLRFTANANVTTQVITVNWTVLRIALA